MENRKARPQRAAINREKVAQVAPPSPIASISTTPPPASTPRASPDSADWIGVINIAALTSMSEILKQSNHPADRELFVWTRANFFTPSVQPHEGRLVATSENFFKLLDVYKRVRSLTNNTVPEKWPFFNSDHRKEMPMKEVRCNAEAARRARIQGYATARQQSASPAQASQDVSTEAAIPQDDVSPETPAAVTAKNTEPVPAPKPLAAMSESVVTNLDRLPPRTNKRKSESASSSPAKKAKTGRQLQSSGRGRGWNLRQGGDTTKASSVTTGTRRTSARLTPKTPIMDTIAPHFQSTEPEDDLAELVRAALSRTNPVQVGSLISSSSERLMQHVGGDDISSRHSVTPTATMLSGSSPAPVNVTGSTQQEPDQTLAATVDSPMRHRSDSQSQSDAGLQQPTELQTPAKATGVTFFARIQTSKGDIEMQFPEKLFTGNMTVFEAYRQFREGEEEDTDLTCKQFERIMKSAP